MLPKVAFQVTALSEAVPWTEAANCKVPPVVTEVVAGETVTEVTTGLGAGAGDGWGCAPVMVMVAAADFVGSAVLVAVTVAVPEVAGAV